MASYISFKSSYADLSIWLGSLWTVTSPQQSKMTFPSWATCVASLPTDLIVSEGSSALRSLNVEWWNNTKTKIDCHAKHLAQRACKKDNMNLIKSVLLPNIQNKKLNSKCKNESSKRIFKKIFKLSETDLKRISKRIFKIISPFPH